MCKSRTPESRAPIYPVQKNVTVIIVSFISLFSPSSDLFSSLPADLNGKTWSSQWPADICRCWRGPVSPSTVFLLSFLLRRRKTHSEDIRKQKLQLCVLPELSLLLPHAGGREREKLGIRHIPCRGKVEAHEHLRALSSLSNLREQQNFFSFHWKYRNRMWLSFPTLQKAPMLPVSQVMQFFRQVATAGGLSYTKWNSKLCFQM